jgi:hypothetical protein
MKPKVEPANHPAAQSLAHVLVGQLVWLDLTYPHWCGRVDSRLAEVVCIKKDRLFISDSSLWSNWRYGFDSLTGKAVNMPGYTMRFATVENIEEEHARLESEAAAKREKERVAAHEAKVRGVAFDLVKALREIATEASRIRPDNSLILAFAEAALDKVSS